MRPSRIFQPTVASVVECCCRHEAAFSVEDDKPDGGQSRPLHLHTRPRTLSIYYSTAGANHVSAHPSSASSIMHQIELQQYDTRTDEGTNIRAGGLTEKLEIQREATREKAQARIWNL